MMLLRIVIDANLALLIIYLDRSQERWPNDHTLLGRLKLLMIDLQSRPLSIHVLFGIRVQATLADLVTFFCRYIFLGDQIRLI